MNFSIKDNISFSDNFKIEDNKIREFNHIEIYDKNGNLINKSNNIVVAIGRSVLLENLFKKYTFVSSGINNNYSLNCFSVGTNGYLNGNIIINNENITEFNELVFNKDLSVTRTDNMSSKPIYLDHNKKKEFSSVSLKKNLNSIYAEIEIELDFSELLGEDISEIAFWLASEDKTKFILFSKINFKSIPKTNTGNSSYYKIIYKLYI